MKGQAQAVTAVMITTIVVGSVAVAYVWSGPILQKSQSEQQLQNTEQKVFQLHNNIIEVSQQGQGTTDKVVIGQNSDTQIQVFEDRDYIEVQTQSQSVKYPLDSWRLIQGKSPQNISIGTGDFGIEGTDKSGVVAVRASGAPESSIVTYRIEFRNLKYESPTGEKLKKIDLESRGRTRSTGETTLLITNQGEEVDSGNDRIQTSEGEQFERRRTVISIDLR